MDLFQQVLTIIGVTIGPVLTFYLGYLIYKQSVKADTSKIKTAEEKAIADQAASAKQETAASNQQKVDGWEALIEAATKSAAAANQSAKEARMHADEIRTENDLLKKERSGNAERIESIERKIRSMIRRDKDFRADFVIYIEKLFEWDDHNRIGPMPRPDEHMIKQLRATYPEDG